MRKLFPFTVSLAFVLILSGCATMQLNEFKKRASTEDYGWIAGQDVTCERASDVCGQLHLIKGDACFRLATAEMETVVHSACAADELSLGLALNPTWKDDGFHRQFQENLCESLCILQDLQSGETVKQTLDRFVDAAEKLYQLAPDSVPAVYYLAKARLEQMAPLLVDMDEATRIPVCNRLKRSVTRVLIIMETADSQPPQTWDRFKKKYQRLSFDLGSAIHMAGCR